MWEFFLNILDTYMKENIWYLFQKRNIDYSYFLGTWTTKRRKTERKTNRKRKENGKSSFLLPVRFKMSCHFLFIFFSHVVFESENFLLCTIAWDMWHILFLSGIFKGFFISHTIHIFFQVSLVIFSIHLSFPSC